MKLCEVIQSALIRSALTLGNADRINADCITSHATSWHSTPVHHHDSNMLSFNKYHPSNGASYTVRLPPYCRRCYQRPPQDVRSIATSQLHQVVAKIANCSHYTQHEKWWMCVLLQLNPMISSVWILAVSNIGGFCLQIPKFWYDGGCQPEPANSTVFFREMKSPRRPALIGEPMIMWTGLGSLP